MINTQPTALLAPDEPAAYDLVNADSGSTLVFLCDHASNRIPWSLRDLGLGSAAIETHIGWDIGAAGLARKLALNFAAPLASTGYSRLVIDCNRPLDAAGSVPEVSAGIGITANRHLSAAAIRDRQDVLFHPYHRAITDLLDRRSARRQPTAILSIHSFTPDYPGEVRPWHIDFASRHDRRLAELLLTRISIPDIVVGDNLPYAVDETDHTIPFHAETRGLPHVLIEVRQDTLATEAGISLWADRLTNLLHRLMPDIDRLAKDSLPS